MTLVINDEAPPDDQYFQDAFHSFLQTSLAQARAENLLDFEVFSSVEGEQTIKGLALCLYCAALHSTTKPPSIALPHVGDAVRSAQHSTLSRTNCPSTFVPLMNLWSGCVPKIQRLEPKRRDKLLRVICGHEPPVLPPVSTDLLKKFYSMAADISQQPSFQDWVKLMSVSPQLDTPPIPPTATSNASESPTIVDSDTMNSTIEPIRETPPTTLADEPKSTTHLHPQLAREGLSVSLTVSISTSASDNMDGGGDIARAQQIAHGHDWRKGQVHQGDGDRDGDNVHPKESRVAGAPA